MIPIQLRRFQAFVSFGAGRKGLSERVQPCFDAFKPVVVKALQGAGRCDRIPVVMLAWHRAEHPLNAAMEVRSNGAHGGGLTNVSQKNHTLRLQELL